MTQRIILTSILLTCCLALTAMPAAAQPHQTCLYAFSKDMCGARLFGGSWGVPACSGPVGPNCTNLVGDNASFQGSWTSSTGACGDTVEVPCDEAPEFGPLFFAQIDLRSQRHTSCKARGSYNGSFRIADASGTSFASGELVASLGVGTHRDTCFGECKTGVCEECHDAQVIDLLFNWRIGTEGTLRGEVVDGQYAGCTFTASYQGNFIANGDSRGPQAPAPGWSFCGSIEGVLECRC